MKKILAVSLLIVFPLAFVPFGLVSVEATNPLEGKIIALDAGHGGEELGATYPANYGVDAQIYEKDVNLAVVYALKEKLEADNNGDVIKDNCVVLTRVCDETLPWRKERVDIAKEKCKSECGGECNVLVSVHHNGSTDTNYDGLLVIYNERQDKPLAIALHDVLWTRLPHNPNGFVDEGLDNGGYGMTVYGHLVSTLTEAYYITNDWEAEQYFPGTLLSVSEYDMSSTCDYQVRFGNRVEEEAEALYHGLFNYFSSSGDGNGGGKPDKCSPWPECNK